jgi:hypothetical protein
MKYIVAAVAALLATSVVAQPFSDSKAVRVGDAYFYKTKQTKSSGLTLEFAVPSVPDGPYLASFAANFVGQATKSSPNTIGCYFQKGSTHLAESHTTVSANYVVGVSASVILTMTATPLTVTCQSDKAPWKFGDIPVRVSLVRLGTLTEDALIAQ